MNTSHNGFVASLLLALIALVLIGGGAYVYSVQKNQENQPATGSVTLPQAASTIPAANQTISTTTVSAQSQSQLELDLAKIIPQFVDDGGKGKYQDGTPLPDSIMNIKKDLKMIPVFKNALDNEPQYVDVEKEVYLKAIGKRYVLLHMPGGKETGTDVVFDSTTQKVSDEIGYWTPILFKTDKIAVYLHPNDICTYILDQSSCVPLPNAKLSGDEFYWSPDLGGGYVQGVWKSGVMKETHTSTSLTIGVYVSGQVGGAIDPKTGLLADTKLRDVTFTLPQ